VALLLSESSRLLAARRHSAIIIYRQAEVGRPLQCRFYCSKKSVACRLHLSLSLSLSLAVWLRLRGSIIKQQRLGDGERMLVRFDPLASSQVLRVKVIPGWAGEFYLKDGRR
jgi:hypothetical protein